MKNSSTEDLLLLGSFLWNMSTRAAFSQDSYAKLTLKHQNWSIHFPNILLLIKPKKQGNFETQQTKTKQYKSTLESATSIMNLQYALFVLPLIMIVEGKYECNMKFSDTTMLNTHLLLWFMYATHCHHCFVFWIISCPMSCSSNCLCIYSDTYHATDDLKFFKGSQSVACFSSCLISQ